MNIDEMIKELRKAQKIIVGVQNALMYDNIYNMLDYCHDYINIIIGDLKRNSNPGMEYSLKEPGNYYEF